MTPPRGRGVDDEIYARRRRKRKRVERKQRRRRAVVFSLAAIFALLFVVGGAAVTGVATFGSSCDLNSLQQVEIGSNTFIYAADNSRLGVIPAERNRQPVELDRISTWMPKATVAIEDRRFYRTTASTRRASPARSGRTSAPGRSSRAARRSRSSSCATSTSAASARSSGS